MLQINYTPVRTSDNFFRPNRYRRVALTDSVITVHTRKMQRRLSIMQIINNT